MYPDSQGQSIAGPITITLSVDGGRLDPAHFKALLERMLSDLTQAAADEKERRFIRTYTFSELAEPRLVIASTFSASGIEPELNRLLAEFSKTKAVVTYNDFMQQLLNPTSDFRLNSHGINIFLFRFTDLCNKSTEESLQNNLNDLLSAISQYSAMSKVPLIICSCAERDSHRFSNIKETFLKQIQEKRLAHVITEEDVQTYYPLTNVYNTFGEQEAHLPYTFEYFNHLSKFMARVYYHFSTSPKKVIVLDCDNTLWAGEVGEDGVDGIKIDEGRKALQRFIIEKIEQGYIVCLCSKNDEENVLRVFKEREDMILKIDHIADYEINWKSKSQNILSLSARLGLGLDSFIFIDDDEAQINEMHHQCPDVLSLQVPQQSDLIPIFLRSIWGLENFHINSPQANEMRTKYYQQNKERNDLKSQATTFREYIEKLGLQIAIESIESEDYPRAVELMRRSNQFNLNKWSHDECTEAHLRELIHQKGYKGLIVKASDKFGSYGLVGLLLYHSVSDYLMVKAFVLSCRALGKGIEYEMLKKLGMLAKLENPQQDNIYILFQANQKNEPASRFLNDAHFSAEKKSEDGQIIYSLPIKEALVVNPPEWAQPGGLLADRNLVIPSADLSNQSILNQNSFVEHQVKNEINSAVQVASLPMVSIDSSNGIIEYLMNLTRDLNLKIESGYSLVRSGLDSVLAVQLVSRIYQDTGIHLDYTHILQPNCDLNHLARLIYEKNIEKEKQPLVLAKSNKAVFLLSREQRRLWESYSQAPSGSKYNISVTYLIKGQLNIALLKKAFDFILHHETIFSYAFNRNKRYQKIDPKKLERFEWDEREIRDDEIGLKENIKKFIQQPFNLEHDCLLRLQLLHNGNGQYILTVSTPHIIYDATSMSILTAHVAKYYNALCSQQEPAILSSTYQYQDYIEWQQQHEKSEQEKHRNYWHELLSGKSIQHLPVMKTANNHLQQSSRIGFSISPEMAQQLEQLASSANATLYHLLLSIFSILIAKYTGHQDVLILTPTSGRQHPHTKQMLGFFVNLVLVSACIKEENNLYQLVTQIQNLVLEGLNHQDYPFIDMLSHLENPEAPLPIGFVFQNYDRASLCLESVSCARMLIESSPLLYDMATETRLGPLTFYMGYEGHALQGLVEYDQSLFAEGNIHSLINHFQILIGKILMNPSESVLHHSLLTASESQQILHEWSHAEASKESDQQEDNKSDLISIFQSQVKATPDKIAVCFGNEKLSYSELDAKSTALAELLHQQLLLGNEDRIAICLPRNINEVIAILAIIKLGCAYVPINPNDPPDRIQYILKDTEAKAILIAEDCLIHFQFITTHKITVNHHTLFPGQSKTFLSSQMKANQLAYIMYTSGSTGRPKGVLIEQQGILRLVVLPGYMEFVSEDKIAQCSNSSFDAATLEFWGGLLNGATLVYPNPKLNILSDVDQFEKFLSENKITVLWLTAALFEAFAFLKPAVFKGLRYLLSGGDKLNPKAVAQVQNGSEEDRPQHFLNGCGPTENTTFSTVFEIKNCNPEEPISIGYPINKTEIFVLDAQRQPVPIGVPGFLYLGGAGLARGYLNQLELTDEKFLKITIAGAEKRLYFTGDIVKWRTDGALDFIGRADNQIKLRGFRIDTGEIEYRLLAHPLIKQAIVLAVSHSENQKSLVACFVTHEPAYQLTSDELRQYLREYLPDYMIPDKLIQRDHLPVTINGKVDRSALVSQIKATNSVCSPTSLPPQTSTEKRFIALVVEALNLTAQSVVNTTSDLFELGFNSINLVRFTKRIKDEFGVEIPASDIWGINSLKKMAERIDGTSSLSKEVGLADASDCFIEWRAGDPNHKLPIIFIHPAGGSPVCYRELIQEFSSNQPCYAISDPSLFRKKQAQEDTINEIALRYLKLIEEKKPKWDKFILCGWSFGGMVGWEMALRSKGKIQGLVLLDSWLVSQASMQAKEALQKSIIQQHYDKYGKQVDADTLNLFIMRQGQGFIYEPSEKLKTPVLLCKAGNSKAVLNMVHPTNYWGEFGDNIQAELVSGDHNTMLSDDYIQDLAGKITCCINGWNRKAKPVYSANQNGGQEGASIENAPALLKRSRSASFLNGKNYTHSNRSPLFSSATYPASKDGLVGSKGEDDRIKQRSITQ